jgi:hypothetical protein
MISTNEKRNRLIFSKIKPSNVEIRNVIIAPAIKPLSARSNSNPNAIQTNSVPAAIPVNVAIITVLSFDFVLTVSKAVN